MLFNITKLYPNRKLAVLVEMCRFEVLIMYVLENSAKLLDGSGTEYIIHVPANPGAERTPEQHLSRSATNHALDHVK